MNAAVGNARSERLQTSEEPSAELDAWCRRQRIVAQFEIRKVHGTGDVEFVIVRADG